MRQHIVDRHHRRDLGTWQDTGEIARKERNLGVDLAVGCTLGAGGAWTISFREQRLLRIEGRDVGGQFRNRERKIAGDPHEWTHAHDLAVSGATCGGDANHAPQAVEFGGGRQPVALAEVGGDIADAADDVAQPDFHAFGHRREIGLAVK